MKIQVILQQSLTIFLFFSTAFSLLGQSDTLLYTKEYNFSIKKSTVDSILKDMYAYGELHPLIKEVTPLFCTKTPEVYKIKERPYVWLPLIIYYKACVQIEGQNIVYEVTDIPKSKAKLTYTIFDSNEGTRVKFQLLLVSNLVGKKILFKKMQKAQDALMNNLQTKTNKS